MKSELSRLLEAVAFLKGKRIIKTQKDIAEAMKYNKSSISSALKGDERYFTDSFIDKFANTFELNSDWIKKGEGSLDNTNSTFSKKLIPLDSSLFQNKEKLHALALFIDRNKEDLRKDYVFEMVFKEIEDDAKKNLLKSLKDKIDNKTEASLKEIRDALISKD